MLEWATNEAGQRVPVRNGILLAAKRDPQREAHRLVNTWATRISDCEAVVVLGLGGGFHIREILNRWPEKRILVVEQDSDLVRELSDFISFENLKILSPKKTNAILSDLDVQDILSSIFSVFEHPVSVRLDEAYYEKMRDWFTGRSREGFEALLHVRPKLRRYLEEIQANSSSIKEISQKVLKAGTPVKEEGLMLLALRELVK